jgi:hypothetical protein
LPQRVFLADDGRQKGITPQMLRIVEILIPQREGKEAFTHQCFDGVFHALVLAPVAETGSQFATDAQTGIDLLQKERPAIAAELPPLKNRPSLFWNRGLEKASGCRNTLFRRIRREIDRYVV